MVLSFSRTVHPCYIQPAYPCYIQPAYPSSCFPVFPIPTNPLYVPPEPIETSISTTIQDSISKIIELLNEFKAEINQRSNRLEALLEKSHQKLMPSVMKFAPISAPTPNLSPVQANIKPNQPPNSQVVGVAKMQFQIANTLQLQQGPSTTKLIPTIIPSTHPHPYKPGFSCNQPKLPQLKPLIPLTTNLFHPKTEIFRFFPFDNKVKEIYMIFGFWPKWRIKYFLQATSLSASLGLQSQLGLEDKTKFGEGSIDMPVGPNPAVKPN